MPYADEEKQKDYQRKWMREYRARQKKDIVFIDKQIRKLQKRKKRLIIMNTPVTC